MTTLCIVGLGLMGASLAMAVRPRYDQIIGVVRREETARKALAQGIVDAAVTDLSQGAPSADVVVLAAPVRVIIEQLRAQTHHFKDGSAVTDLGSTKHEIVKVMDALPPRLRAVGGHPMCGKETSGIDEAQADLYRGKTWVLCRTARTDEESFNIAITLAESAGARAVEIAPDRHDQLVALISHLPYSVASALAATVDAASVNDPDVATLAASGYRDTTRIAASDVDMTLDILLTNADKVLATLRDFQFNLDQFAAMLERTDEQGLRAYLNAAATSRRRMNAQ